MKRILIRLSRWIDERYGVSPEINDIVIFQGKKYVIEKYNLVRERGSVDELIITLYHPYIREDMIKK